MFVAFFIPRIVSLFVHNEPKADKEAHMQQLLVVSLLAIAAFLLSRRLWRTLRSANPPGCGCACTGCPPVNKSTRGSQSLPMFKP